MRATMMMQPIYHVHRLLVRSIEKLSLLANCTDFPFPDSHSRSRATNSGLYQILFDRIIFTARTFPSVREITIVMEVRGFSFEYRHWTAQQYALMNALGRMPNVDVVRLRKVSHPPIRPMVIELTRRTRGPVLNAITDQQPQPQLPAQ